MTLNSRSCGSGLPACVVPSAMTLSCIFGLCTSVAFPVTPGSWAGTSSSSSSASNLFRLSFFSFFLLRFSRAAAAALSFSSCSCQTSSTGLQVFGISRSCHPFLSLLLTVTLYSCAGRCGGALSSCAAVACCHSGLCHRCDSPVAFPRLTAFAAPAPWHAAAHIDPPLGHVTLFPLVF